ncbi:hypothetical protein, partial [Roseiflexus sp.]
MQIFGPKSMSVLMVAYLIVFLCLGSLMLIVSIMVNSFAIFILFTLMIAVPFIIVVKRSQGNLTALTECPVLDVWNYEDSEGDFHHFVAWELTVIDRYGKTRRYRQAQKISKELHDYLQTRATVQVRYAPDQPDISMLDEQWVAAVKGASST